MDTSYVYESGRIAMVDAWLPYGRSEVCARVDARNFLGLIEPKEKAGVADALAEVRRAVKEPVGSRVLGELVRPESRVAIVVDDATRALPTGLMVAPLLDELNAVGAKDENVTVVFGTGIHRAVTHEEAVRLLGEAVFNRVKSVSHDSGASDLVYVGQTKKHGTKVFLNRVFTEADVRILTGDVCLHYFAGYGGGRKSVLPGVAGEETIKRNHAMLLDSNARTGVLEGNPVHEDMVEAARLAKVDFVLNVVTNSKGEIVKAFAGDLEQVFAEGVKVVDEMYRVSVDRRADIVVVSSGGYPADVNLFQAYKAVDNALEVVKRGGVIVLVAECGEGHGNDVFYDWMVKYGDLRSIEREIKRSFVLGGHKAYYLLKAMQNHTIILVSSMPDCYAANVFRLKTARAVNAALSQAFDAAGKSARVWVMPYGNFTLPEVKTAEEQIPVASG
jgi:nickel-dependent lactate racemase